MPLDLRPELLLTDTASSADTPPPVQQHVGSLEALISNIAAEGEISLAAARFATMFARRHDAGYGTNLALLDHPKTPEILQAGLEAVDSTASPTQVANYLRKHYDNYLAARVVGHGVLGLIENTLYLQRYHTSTRQALGVAALLSAHHPGFPITMVSQFLEKSAPLPDSLRSAFFVDNNGDNPETTRQQLIELGAAKLNLPYEDAAKAALLGYSLDRITPGRTPNAITLQENGATIVSGGEVIQKKYELVADDLCRDPNIDSPNVELLYNTVIDRLKCEAEAALQATHFANQTDLHLFVEEQAKRVIMATQKAQKGALAALYNNQLSGQFKNIHTERAALLIKALQTDDYSLKYALATYDVIKSNIT